jgi:hypothetical protein
MEVRTLENLCGRVSALVVIITLGVACHSKESDRGTAPANGSDLSTQTDPDHTFWNWFSDEAPSLWTASKVDAMQRIQRELERQHHGVFAEIGSDGGGRLLVLTADGDRSQFPTVQRLFAARPNVKGWKIVAFRPREAKPFSKIAMNNRDLDPATLRYVARRKNDKLDIKLYVAGYTEGDKEIGLMGFLALDHTVGEYDVETKLGGIELLPIAQAPAVSRALEELPGEIDALGTSP